MARATRVTLVGTGRFDPTRTLILRRDYEWHLSGRFLRLMAAIRDSIMTRDVFGLQKKRALDVGITRDFALLPPDQQMHLYLAWLRRESEALVLEGIRTPAGSDAPVPWQSTYLRAAYRRGVETASRDAERAGIHSETFAAEGVMRHPVHQQMLGILLASSFEGLRGICHAMVNGIGQELSRAFIAGAGPQEIARRLVNSAQVLGRTRARILAQTEMVRAFNEALLTQYTSLGIASVTASVETRSAQESTTCPQCVSLTARRYTVTEARGMLPLHPTCKCRWIMVNATPGGASL